MAAVQGAVTGGVAAASGGMSLAAQVGFGGATNVVMGVAGRQALNEPQTPYGIAFDFVVGQMGGLGASMAAKTAQRARASAAFQAWIKSRPRHEAERFLRRALNKQGLDSVPASFKHKWVEEGYEYVVRIHPAEPNYGKTGSIYRVARRAVGPWKSKQGPGWDYLDDADVWHHVSTLKPGKNGSVNATYNHEAARRTHIQVP